MSLPSLCTCACFNGIRVSQEEAAAKKALKKYAVSARLGRRPKREYFDALEKIEEAEVSIAQFEEFKQKLVVRAHFSVFAPVNKKKLNTGIMKYVHVMYLQVLHHLITNALNHRRVQRKIRHMLRMPLSV